MKDVKLKKEKDGWVVSYKIKRGVTYSRRYLTAYRALCEYLRLRLQTQQNNFIKRNKK